jgi:hypothetical protein
MKIRPVDPGLLLAYRLMTKLIAFSRNFANALTNSRVSSCKLPLNLSDINTNLKT